MSSAGLWPACLAQTDRPDGWRIARALLPAVPALLFGLRLWIAVCLALYVAFCLELDNAYWAGTSAAVVCQPSLGASLRKGSFRMIGTMIGAVAIVVLTACFPQQRVGFLVGLALWGAACVFVATLLRNFSTYSAALAGLTAVVIASDELGSVGGANGEAFSLAVTRASEICIGIVCAGVVLAGTDLGGARRRLASQLASISSEIAGGFTGTFLLDGPEEAKTRPIRRDLIKRVIALEPVVDGAQGEASDLRAHSPILRAAIGGLFAALSGWRLAALHLELRPNDESRQEARVIYRILPQELLPTLPEGTAASWMADPFRVRRACGAAVRALIALPVRTPSLRLLADQTAEALTGIQRALDGLLLLTDAVRPMRSFGAPRLHVPDSLPALVNATRVFIVIGVVELFWVATGWPDGALAVTWSAIFVIVFSPTADQAYANAKSRLVGISVACILAAIIKFAVLPGRETFAGLAIAISPVLIVAGALSTLPWRSSMFGAVASWFLPLVQPANPITYDTQQFYNSSLAIVSGAAAATLAFRLLPPLSPAFRTRRLLALSLQDLRRLTTRAIPRTAQDWESRIYSRLSALPEDAQPVQRAQLLTALSVGTEILRLRRAAVRLDLHHDLDAALDAVARGNSGVAVERLALLDERLAAPCAEAELPIRLRARGSIVAILEGLRHHASYFDSGAPT
jgi:uncharacterized membrane protein YccC